MFKIMKLAILEFAQSSPSWMAIIVFDIDVLDKIKQTTLEICLQATTFTRCSLSNAHTDACTYI